MGEAVCLRMAAVPLAVITVCLMPQPGLPAALSPWGEHAKMAAAKEKNSGYVQSCRQMRRSRVWSQHQIGTRDGGDQGFNGCRVQPFDRASVTSIQRVLPAAAHRAGWQAHGDAHARHTLGKETNNLLDPRCRIFANAISCRRTDEQTTSANRRASKRGQHLPQCDFHAHRTGYDTAVSLDFQAGSAGLRRIGNIGASRK